MWIDEDIAEARRTLCWPLAMCGAAQCKIRKYLLTGQGLGGFEESCPPDVVFCYLRGIRQPEGMPSPPLLHKLHRGVPLRVNRGGRSHSVIEGPPLLTVARQGFAVRTDVFAGRGRCVKSSSDKLSLEQQLSWTSSACVTWQSFLCRR